MTVYAIPEYAVRYDARRHGRHTVLMQKFGPFVLLRVPLRYQVEALWQPLPDRISRCMAEPLIAGLLPIRELVPVHAVLLKGETSIMTS
jgi:hypothetical protein